MNSIIEEAEALCARSGQVLTTPRRRVLELLAKSPTPMKAYDLINQAGEGGVPTKPPTVYRALEFLCQLGLVHRIEQDSTFVACSHSGHSHPVALLVCDTCLQVTEIDFEAANQLVYATAQKRGFALKALVVEGRGECPTCAAA